jgi:hemerythrin-like domain-containing protein
MIRYRERRSAPGTKAADGAEARDHGISVETSSDRYERFTALGNQLIDIHHRLLDAVDDLRAGGQPSRELADHCLAFCAALTRHHTGEDSTVFPELARRFPELRDVLAGLERDHHMMAGMLQRITELAGALDTDGALAELDGLAALLESHFAWEEKRLAAVLNSLEPGAMAPRW